MASKNFRLYWSGLETFTQCPRQFLWARGWDKIDLGHGPGRKIPNPVKRSEHHAYVGSVVAATMEHIYLQRLWEDPANAATRVRDLVVEEFNKQEKDFYVEYQRDPSDKSWKKATSRGDLLQDAITGSVMFLKTMRVHKLLGTVNLPEFRMDTRLQIGGHDIPVGGIADLVIDRPDKGLCIYDGKMSGKVGVYTSGDQLRWYALCHYLMTGRVPDRLYFIYLRYPPGTPTSEVRGNPPKDLPWNGLVEVPLSPDDLPRLAKMTQGFWEAAHRHEFPAKPVAKVCDFCDYNTICQDRIEQKHRNAAKRQAKAIPLAKIGPDGTVDFGD